MVPFTEHLCFHYLISFYHHLHLADKKASLERLSSSSYPLESLADVHPLLGELPMEALGLSAMKIARDLQPTSPLTPFPWLPGPGVGSWSSLGHSEAPSGNAELGHS